MALNIRFVISGFKFFESMWIVFSVSSMPFGFEIFSLYLFILTLDLHFKSIIFFHMGNFKRVLSLKVVCHCHRVKVEKQGQVCH